METPKKKDSWLTKAVFITIAVSFVATSFRQGALRMGDPAVLTIGGREVRTKEFRRLFQNKISMLSVLYGNVSKESHRREITEMAIESVINDKLLDLELERLGIEVSDNMAMENIKKNHEFFDKNGKFSSKIFCDKASYFGLSEKLFIEEEKKAIARELLTQALKAQLLCPNVLLNSIIKGRFQKRSFAYKFFNENTVTVRAPEESDLKKMYSDMNGEVYAPEYRSCSIIYISVTDLAKKISIKEAEIRELYKNRGITAEFETVKQDLENELKASAAKKKRESIISKIEDFLGEGRSIEYIAKQLFLPISTITVDEKGNDTSGKMEKSLGFIEMKEKAKDARTSLLSAIFGMKKGQDPELKHVFGGISYMIALNKISPKKKMSFAEAKRVLENMWTAAKRRETAVALANEYKDKILQNGKIDETSISKTDCIIEQGISVTDSENSSPPAVKEAAFFFLKPGELAVVPVKNGAYVVGLIRIDVVDPDTIQEDERSALEDGAVSELQRVFWSAYLKTLRHRYPDLSVKRANNAVGLEGEAYQNSCDSFSDEDAEQPLSDINDD